MGSYRQGVFKPRHPEKYKGDPTNIIYRSSWELKLMMMLDTNDNVLWWNSEEIIIWYRCPTDNRIHRYFPDFKVCYRLQGGGTKIVLIEIKPQVQTQPPKVPAKGKTKRYINEVFTYGKNQAKWKAAKEYCKKNKMEFVIMTENELQIPRR